MQCLSYENEFDLRESESVSGTHFHLKISESNFSNERFRMKTRFEKEAKGN